MLSCFSLILYMPLPVTRWLKLCPAWPTSTSYTSVQRVTHNRPSGKSIRAQSKALWDLSCVVSSLPGLLMLPGQKFTSLTERLLSLHLQVLSCFMDHSTCCSAFPLNHRSALPLTLLPEHNCTHNKTNTADSTASPIPVLPLCTFNYLEIYFLIA